MKHSNPAPRSTPTAPALARRDLLAFGAGVAGASLAGCATSQEAAAPALPAPAAGGGDDPFSELSDQRGTAQPISPAEHAARRERLAGLLAERGLDAWFSEGGPTMTYLSGTSWGHSERVYGLLVLADGRHLWICPGFEAEKARLRIEADDGPGGEIVTWEEHQYARGAFAATLADNGVERVALDPEARWLVADELRAAGVGHDRLVSGREVLVAMRGRKDEHELELIRRANELTQQAIVAAAARVEVGMTGSDVSRLMRAAQSKLGLSGVWVLALIGPGAAYPHGGNHSIALGEGDFLLVDTGGSFHGYQSDNTRTWVPHGRPDAKMEQVWYTVRDAQLAAFEAIRPGLRCAEIDRAARDVIDAAGFGPDYRTFTHRLGHGIGMRGHEDPYFDLGSEVVLEPGMTLSNEPGIYLYDEFGVRLEDIVAVTDDGADHFGDWQAGPASPASET